MRTFGHSLTLTLQHQNLLHVQYYIDIGRERKAFGVPSTNGIRHLIDRNTCFTCLCIQDYVDIEGEEGIEVAITNEPGLGTVYSVNIPIRRVKVREFVRPLSASAHQPTCEVGGKWAEKPPVQTVHGCLSKM